MIINRSITFLFVVTISLSLSINSDSYIELNERGYTFSFESAKVPVTINVTGLPQGIDLQNYTIIPTAPVLPGQYILSVKAVDAANAKDEKIIILNVNQKFTAYNPQPTLTLVTQLPKSSTSSAVQSTQQISASSSSTKITNQINNSSIASLSSFFQVNPTNVPTVSSKVQTNSLNHVDSLQNYFNQINVGQSGSSQNTAGNSLISNNINDILNDFSNSSAESNYSMIIKTSSEQVYTQPTISLNFNDSQKSTISTQQANILFLQQKQASQYVAGNYSIVVQLTANKNMLNSLISNLTLTYQKNSDLVKDLNLNISIKSANKSKIQSAINNLNGYLTTLKTQIDASSNKLTQLKNQNIALLSQSSSTQSSVNQLSQDIQSLADKIAIANSNLNNNTQTCTLIGSNLLQTNKTLNVNNIQLGLIKQQLEASNKDVINKQNIVDDLMRQLALAQQALQLAKNNSAQLTSQQSQLQQIISTLNQNVTVISESLNTCNLQTSSTKSQIQSLKDGMTAKQTQLSQYTNKNSSEMNQLSSLQSQISQESANLNSLQNQTSNANSALTLLQNALPDATKSLQILVKQSSQAGLSLQNDQATLNAAIERFKMESSNLQLATMNLQNARALSQKADQQVNLMLASKGNILPYAVAVNESKNALIGQTIVSSTINIANWFNYLSANFGSAAFPYQSSQISCLYKFSLSNLRNDVQCPLQSATLQSFTGKITEVNSFNEIIVVIDGSGVKQIVDIPCCAQLTANIDGYRITTGDSVIIKAESRGGKAVARNIVFLRK